MNFNILDWFVKLQVNLKKNLRPRLSDDGMKDKNFYIGALLLKMYLHFWICQCNLKTILKKRTPWFIYWVLYINPDVSPDFHVGALGHSKGTLYRIYAMLLHLEKQSCNHREIFLFPRIQYCKR